MSCKSCLLQFTVTFWLSLKSLFFFFNLEFNIKQHLSDFNNAYKPSTQWVSWVSSVKCNWGSDFLPEPASSVFQTWNFVSPERRRRSQTCGGHQGQRLSSAGSRGSPVDHHQCQQQLLSLLSLDHTIALYLFSVWGQNKPTCSSHRIQRHIRWRGTEWMDERCNI